MPAGNLPRGVLKSGRGSLVRDVIYDALCGPKGYFATRLPVLAAHTALPFREMTGRADYERALTERYAERAGFLTPAEIFAPWYSYAAARWALAWHRVDAAKAARVGLRPPQLRVAEFGVGSGAHAVHFLDYVRTHAPAVFATCRYAGVDASQGACAAFEARLRAAHPGVAATIVADARSAWALPEGFSDDSTPTVVFALELLDNLPHDKVRGGFEGWVVDGREDFRPVSDPWVRKALALETVGGDAFVPTGALQFLARVFAGAPRPRLFLADFSQLPRPEGATAANAPLVAAADRDLDSYLDAQGDADIFFATDFDWLSRAYASSGGVGAVAAAAPPAEFFVRAPDLAAATSTRSGYNPLLEDFWNTRIFLAPGQGVA
jgi:hypothetical protein